jgi:hypothetical protein
MQPRPCISTSRGQEFGHHRICNRYGTSHKAFGLQLRCLENEKLDVTSAYVSSDSPEFYIRRPALGFNPD